MLKKLTLHDVDIWYETITSQDGSYYLTKLYFEPVEVRVKKYWLFGKYITKVKYKYTININFNIESDLYSANFVREYLLNIIKQLKRKKEIEEGNII